MRRFVVLPILICALIVAVRARLDADPTPTPVPHGHRVLDSNRFHLPPNAGFEQPPPAVETPTTLTFYDNPDLTGASYTVSLMPPPTIEATRVIAQSELTGAGLAGKVNSVRIVCGTRSSRASLFDMDWSEFSDGTMIECTPSQTTSIQLAPPGLGRVLDSKINAAALVAHVRTSDDKTHLVIFSTLFSAVWKAQVKSLGSGATAKWTQIWLEDFQDVHIEQALTLDSTWCGARDAVFDLRINLSAASFKPVFKVYTVSEWVDSGFGDEWGCHSGMVKSLGDGLRNASAQIETRLPRLVLGNPSSSVFYFAPEGNTHDYDLFHWQ